MSARKKQARRPKPMDPMTAQYMADTERFLSDLNVRVAALEREMAAQLAIRDALATAVSASAALGQAKEAEDKARKRYMETVFADYDRRHPLPEQVKKWMQHITATFEPGKTTGGSGTVRPPDSHDFSWIDRRPL